MATLGELARLIRSKNAGPFTLTFDVMFDSEDAYRKVLAARVLVERRLHFGDPASSTPRS